MKDKMILKGRITIKNITNNSIIQFENLITSAGLSLFADRLIDNNVNYITHLGIGNGSGTHDTSSTILFNEVFRKEVSSVSSPGTIAEFHFTIDGDEAVGEWTELGMFNASNNGVMSNVVNQTYNHQSGDALELKWEIVHN